MQTIEFHLKMFNALDAECTRQHRALVKACKDYDKLGYSADEETREIACALLEIKSAQYEVIREKVAEYYNSYIDGKI